MKLIYNFPGIVLLFLFIFSTNANAQLCQGSLGDPIIDITFGSGTNPGPPLSAATTNYQYVTTDCPNDGYYAVRNSTANCFGNNWFTLTSDHTGNTNGYFMLVNASIQPSAFYLDTVRGLCPNTTFEFAAWVMNISVPPSCNGNSILPDLTFRIEKTDGTLLQSYNTNGISTNATPIWNQYGFFFTTPAGVTDVVLRIINNAPGGCGNDLALDDITFRPCGPSITSSVIGYPSTNISLCQGTAQSFQFNCTVSGGFNNPSFQWQQNFNNIGWTDISGATNINYSISFNASALPGTYSYRLAVAEAGNINSVQCRVVSPIISIQINTLPTTNVSNNGPVCTGKSLLFNATAGTVYNWTGPANFNSTIANPIIDNVQLLNAGKYFVEVSNAAGCLMTDSTIVLVNPKPLAATAFSDTSICTGNRVTLTGSGGTSWQWIPAIGLSSSTINDPVATPTDTTLYQFVASNQFGCTDTAYTKVNVIKMPLVNAGPDRAIIAGNSITLNGSIAGSFNFFYWTPAQNIDNVQKLQPVINPPMDMNYILLASALNACGIVTDTMHVKVFSQIYIPNAFTPNGDGINDTWNIPALAAFSNFELFVFNRYGQIVFQEKNSNTVWDGKYKGAALPQGSYTYMLDLKNGFPPIKGSVLIIR